MAPAPPTPPVVTPTPPVIPTPPVTPTPPPEDGAPVINSFTASSTSVGAGDSVTLSWDVTNSEIIRLTPDPGQGDLSFETGVTVTPTATTTYTLEAVSLNGLDDTASVTVTVDGSSQPPTSEVPFYGQWLVTFTSDLGTTFAHTLNITDSPPSGSNLQNGGFGLHTLCTDEFNSCTDVEPGDSASGFGFIGDLPLDNGSAPLTIAIFTQFSLADEAFLKIVNTGDATETTDSLGNQLLLDDAVWYDGDELVAEGTMRALRVGDPITLEETSSPADLAQQIDMDKVLRLDLLRK